MHFLYTQFGSLWLAKTEPAPKWLIWPDSLQEVTPVITEPILQCRLFQPHSPAHLETLLSSLQPSSKPFYFHYVIPISWMKDQGIYQSCSWGFASSSTQSLTSTVRLMLMKKEGSQILGWTRAWLDPTISGLRLPQRPYWHQLALLPSRTFPPLKSSLIQKGKQHWWKRIWASWQRPGSALSSTSPLLSLSSPFHSWTWRAMMPYGAIGELHTSHIHKGFSTALDSQC